MRIGYIGCFSDFHTEVEIAAYLIYAGHSVDRYQFDRMDEHKFLRQVDQFDLVITSLPQTHSPEFWRAVGQETRTVAWYFDWIANWGGREQQYLPRLREFDLVVSTDGFENDIYRGLRRVWLPHACDPRVYKPVSMRATRDVGFIGHMYLPRRREMIRTLIKKYDFAQYGLNNECWGAGYANACASVQIMVGDNFINTVPGYWSDRLYLSLACGAFLLYPRVPGIERYFEDGKHLVCYDSEEHLHHLIDHYLQYPDERYQIAAAGCARAHERESWTQRISSFEDILRVSGLWVTPTSPAESDCSSTTSGRISEIPSSASTRG